MNWLRAIRLWLRIVGREWEAPGTVPESYRVHHRMGVVESWHIAWDTHVRSYHDEELPW